jgi:ABC-type Fe3+/spermidine/putrescine transport system ATPase subunit
LSRLKLSGVSKNYGDFFAVDSIDLELQSGEFVSLLGPSGCGKTTTLRMIAGFVDPTAGIIEMDGQVLSSPAGSVPPDRRQMSMIFQSYAIWPNMTVQQNVAFGLELRRMPNAEVKRRVGEMLEVVHMNHLADRYPAELSGGQQQRVALARAIVIRPSVLLLDEPLSNLDATLREEMRFEIRRLHDEFRVTTVYVTHDQAEAMVTSDRIAVMNHGRIEQVDHPRALYNKPTTRFVAGFIGRTNFIEGTSNGHEISFDGFALPRSAFERDVPAEGKVVFSVRPHNMRLSEVPSTARDGCTSIGVIVVERAFLGEHWDYIVKPRDGALTLKVTTSPLDDFPIGATAWLEFEPRQMASIV